MSKRNIAYTKPQDPKFLQQLKQQIGYREGPSVETKRQKFEDLKGDLIQDEEIEREDEKPQVVVLKAGDLTAQEVAFEEKRLAKEIAETPVDLSKRIVFCKRSNPAGNKLEIASVPKAVRKIEESKKKESKLKRDNSSKLSFNIEDGDE